MNSLGIKIRFRPHKDHSMLPGKSCSRSRYAVLYAACSFTAMPTNAWNCTVHWATSIQFNLQILFLKYQFWYYLPTYICLSCGFSPFGTLTTILWKFSFAPEM